MIFSAEKDIEDHVIEFLADGKATIKKVYAEIIKKEKVSLRAVYKAVNKLIDAGVVLKIGKHIFLDKEWVGKVKDQIGSRSGLPYLNQGEKIVYTMTSITHLDAFWKTLLLSLDIEERYPVFIYNPHNFWIYVPGREESEELFYKSFEANKRYAFFVIGGETELDMSVKKKYQSEYLKLNVSKISTLKETEHITVWQDYVITVIVPKDLTKEIEKVYWSDGGAESIQTVLQQDGVYKVRVERNIIKARKLRKVIGKDFYIPREIREAYDL